MAKHNSGMKRAGWALSLAILVGCVWGSQVVAQQSEQGLSVAPLVFELNANPGDVLSEQIRVTNRSAAPVTVVPEVRDFTPLGETGEVQLEDEERGTFSLRAWTSVAPERLTLAAGETRMITFTIRVPRNAEPGGHYGSVLATTGGTPVAGQTGAIVAQKVGTLVLLRVAGEANENLSVKEFSAPSFLEKGPVPFTLRFENTGNIHVRPAGFITITDLFGRTVANIDLPQKNVLPGSVRRLDVAWEVGSGLGRYTATLTAVYGSRQQNVSASTTFTVFPWKVGLPVAAGVLLLFIFLIRHRDRIARALAILFGRA